MFAVVSLGAVAEHAVGLRQLQSCFAVHLHITQRSGIVIGLGVYRSAVEPFVVAGTKQEDALVLLLRVDGLVSRCCHIAGEVIACMRHDDSCQIAIGLTSAVQVQETVYLLRELLRITHVETVCLRGWSHHRRLRALLVSPWISLCW